MYSGHSLGDVTNKSIVAFTKIILGSFSTDFNLMKLQTIFKQLKVLFLPDINFVLPMRCMCQRGVCHISTLLLLLHSSQHWPHED